MDANARVNKTRQALMTLRLELQEKGKTEQVKALDAVLSCEMSVLRLAAILAPKN